MVARADDPLESVWNWEEVWSFGGLRNIRIYLHSWEALAVGVSGERRFVCVEKWRRPAKIDLSRRHMRACWSLSLP